MKTFTAIKYKTLINNNMVYKITKQRISVHPRLLKFFSLLILTVTFFSCEKILDVKLPDNDKRLVVNSIFNTDSVFKVNLSKSLHVLDNNQVLFLPGAKVLLYENNTMVDTMIYIENGNYIAENFYPVAGKNYKITVDYTGLNQASAENIIPNDIEIISIDTMSVKRNDEDKVKCTLKFKDPSGSNYYVLKVYRYYTNYYTEEGMPDSSYSFIYIDSDDPVIDADKGYTDEVTFTDEMFNDKEYNLSIYLSYWDVANYYYEGGSDTSLIYFQLKSVSPEYYYYSKSYNQYINTHGNPFSEPVQVFSNIENGFGIFAGFSNSTKILIFSGYVTDDYMME